MKNHKYEIIIDITVSQDKKYLYLHTNKGKHIYYAEGDCCSNSWIEHIDDPKSFIGSKIIETIEMNNGNAISTEEIDCCDVIKSYQTCIKTNKGDFHIEYRNSSNGFYGGYLVYTGKEDSIEKG